MSEAASSAEGRCWTRHAGADWLAHFLGIELSPLASKVADLLGWVEEGLYHMDFGALRRAEWGDRYVSIVLRTSLSSFDNSRLTRLVVGAYDLNLRVEIRAASPHCLRLYFIECDGRSACGDMPSIERQIERLRIRRWTNV